MRVRWIGLTLALVLVGLAVGYGVGHLREQEPRTFAGARPVPARQPSIPVLPTPPFAEDIDYPALEPGLDYRKRRLGDPPYYLWTYDAPRGWTVSIQGLDELRWRPPSEPLVGGYSLRVKLPNEHKTPEQMVEQKHEDMLASYDDVTFLKETGQTIYFSYRDPDADTLRFNMFAWFSTPGSDEADFEMSVVGRKADVPGLLDLGEHVAASVTKVG